VANQVRVFFRIFTSQTTAALTYRQPAGGEPLDGYRKTNAGNPIAIPGINNTGSAWVSYPFFAENRSDDPNTQNDNNNVKNITPSIGREVSTFFGALIDSNSNDPYLPLAPGGLSGNVGLSTLLMGEHQCLVAQIEFAGTPIPDGAKPNTSDKLAQRNLAISAVANPGLAPSRIAFHTFELEATPGMITDSMLPDELMLQWEGKVPEGTMVKVYIPGWDSKSVLELAEKNYKLHELAAEDPHTILLPGGGTQYIPIPRCQYRQTGIISVHLPLGIVKGQRYNLVVRQVTNKQYQVKLPPGSGKYITQKQATSIIRELQRNSNDLLIKRPENKGQKVFYLPNNQVLYTDTAFLNNGEGKALLYQAIDPKIIAESRKQEGKWREVIGAFQLGIEVSVKEEMLQYHLQLLSIFKWRLEKLNQKNPWFKTLSLYLEMLSQKVQGLGGDPFQVKPTPDGSGGMIESNKNPDNLNNPSPNTPSSESSSALFLEPHTDDWLGESKGLIEPVKAGAKIISGKIRGIIYDHFGDFEGFVLETYSGNHQRFFSQEKEIECIAKNAWQERYLVTVITTGTDSWKVRRVMIS
jgi:hypothetical protein